MSVSKPVILVIDDEESILENISELLSWDDYYVITAESGIKGIQLAMEIQPNLILCDIMMPDLSGYEVLQALRSNKPTSTTPFIFLSALTGKEHIRKGMKLGADDYLSKPFSNSELLSAVHARLQRLEDIQTEYQQDLEMARKSFTQMVAHELRTPLISIVMVQELISKKAGQLSPEQLQDLMGTMESGTRRLRHLVEQVVFLNQLESRLLNENVIQESGIFMSLEYLVQESLNIAKLFVYRNKSHEVSLSLPPQKYHFRCDSSALKQALAELICNALNFSPAEESISISATEKNGWIWLRIQDFGTGIPQDKIRLAQQEFQQVNREKQEQQGLGLGLPLAKRIISIHKGELELKSVAGQGTEALVKLPWAKA